MIQPEHHPLGVQLWLMSECLRVGECGRSAPALPRSLLNWGSSSGIMLQPFLGIKGFWWAAEMWKV